ncbi:Cys/Met metabolism PLP-dependent enzyme-domain-containing protein [Suillus occidentalis]|nr:Cys/Met metabolism PLP-dependent enzyme-domain-containing protein [Suillus occidentalis]
MLEKQGRLKNRGGDMEEQTRGNLDKILQRTPGNRCSRARKDAWVPTMHSTSGFQNPALNFQAVRDDGRSPLLRDLPIHEDERRGKTLSRLAAGWYLKSFEYLCNMTECNPLPEQGCGAVKMRICMELGDCSCGSASVLTPGSLVLRMLDVNVYDGTYLTKAAKETMGIGLTVQVVDLKNATGGDLRGTIQENTKLIWIESPTNLTFCLIDALRIVALMRQAPLVLVNHTFLSLFYASPLLQGADIVTKSLTKYINGHSDAILPSSSTTAPPKSFTSSRMHTAPYPCGPKDLAVRMKTHSLNALCIVSFLTSHPAVEHVIYPSFASHLRHVLARTSLSTFPQSTLAHGIPYGGIVLFHYLAGSLGVEGLMRLSCGIEEVEDLMGMHWRAWRMVIAAFGAVDIYHDIVANISLPIRWRNVNFSLTV